MISCIDQRERVVNTDRRFGSWTHYYPAVVIDMHGDERRALFTYDQITTAVKRAEKNPEDFEKKAEKDGMWRGFVDRIFGGNR